MHRSSQWSLTFGLPNQTPANTFPLPHACHMSRPPHPSVLGGSLVTMAWRVLSLRMEGRPPDMEGSCEYIE
jgi:hypothetical protein